MHTAHVSRFEAALRRPVCNAVTLSHVQGDDDDEEPPAPASTPASSTDPSVPLPSRASMHAMPTDRGTAGDIKLAQTQSHVCSGVFLLFRQVHFKCGSVQRCIGCVIKCETGVVWHLGVLLAGLVDYADDEDEGDGSLHSPTRSSDFMPSVASPGVAIAEAAGSVLLSLRSRNMPVRQQGKRGGGGGCLQCHMVNLFTVLVI